MTTFPAISDGAVDPATTWAQCHVVCRALGYYQINGIFSAAAKIPVEQSQLDSQLAADGVTWAAFGGYSAQCPTLAADHAGLWSKAADRGAGRWPVLRHHGGRGSRRVHGRTACLASSSNVRHEALGHNCIIPLTSRQCLLRFRSRYEKFTVFRRFAIRTD